MKQRYSTPLRLIFSAFFLFFISHISVLGQGRWENYSREEALLDPATLCLFGDSNGNVWFGHENGVTKYDGETYTWKNQPT